jgi:hypothetical protein
MERRIPCIDGWECDTFSTWREFMIHRAGKFTAIKRRYRKRARQTFKKEIANELSSYDDFDYDIDDPSEYWEIHDKE